eukprot:12323414-Ditylum_brightwellii.AAC.1
MLDATHDAVLQRYALAVFHYSTHQEYDAYSTGANSGDSTVEDNDDDWIMSDNWMTDKGICMWFGVQCMPYTNLEGSATFDDDVAAVTHLTLSSNGIRGVLPPEIFKALDQMRVLDLSQNLLGGTLSPEIGNLLSLEELNIESNVLIGSIPSTIGKMTNLLVLNAGANSLTGPIPSQIEQLYNLEYVVLEQNSLTGRISNSFGTSLSNIVSLYLGDNSLTGTIPSTL